MQRRRSRAKRRLRHAKPAPPAFAQGNTALGLFTATTFLSAFLLFAIQPLFAKMVLPVLGGSPSVWAVALCFFQAALLAGYCYAYLLMRLVPVVWTGSVHICVALLALFVLPIGSSTLHACKTFFNFKTVFPAHYGTFPIIDQTADAFVAEMKGYNVVVPKLGELVTV